MDSTSTYIFQSLPEWLTAIGTISTVIVALYLARRDRSIQCVAESTIYVLIDPNVNVTSEYVSITVTNIGTRVFTLRGVSWRMGLFKKDTYFMVPPPNSYSSKVPVKLNDGDQANFYFPITNFRQRDIAILLSKSPKYFKSIWVLFCRVLVHTSTGQSFVFGVHKSIRQEILGKRKSVTK